VWANRYVRSPPEYPFEHDHHQETDHHHVEGPEPAMHQDLVDDDLRGERREESEDLEDQRGHQHVSELSPISDDEGQEPPEAESHMRGFGRPARCEQHDTTAPADLEIGPRDDAHPQRTGLLNERARPVGPDENEVGPVAIHEQRRKRDLAEAAPGSRHLAGLEPEVSRRLAHRGRRYGGIRATVSPVQIRRIGRQPVVSRDDAQREEPRA